MSLAFSMTAWLQRRIVPELRYSQAQFEEHLRAHSAAATAWLDLGCGHHLLPLWREEAELTMIGACPLVVGLDYDFDSVRKHRSIRNRLRGDASVLPFADGTFDLVTANMVVEHLSDPEGQFAEVARVLRPGGVFLFHTPNDESYLIALAKLFPDGVKKFLARVLEKRVASDVFPTHYRANRPSTVREIADHCGFSVARLDLILTSPVTSALPPFALIELLFLRQLQRPSLARLRPNLICALRKPPAAADREVPVLVAAERVGGGAPRVPRPGQAPRREVDLPASRS